MITQRPTPLTYLTPGYLLSLPERVVRAAAALLGGLLFELTEVGLPRVVRRSRLYQALVYRLLRLAVELVGDVQGVFPAEEMGVGELATRKAVGNVIELAGFLAVGWSPLWLLAAASDLTGGTRAYLNLFVAELQQAGLLTEGQDIGSVDELLGALEGSSGVMADLVDVPPLNLRDLQASWQGLRQNAHNLPNPAQLTLIYQELQQVAQQEGRSLGSLSGLIASGALRAGVQMGSTLVFDYYAQALRAIQAEGWLAYTRRVARPYLVVARGHFSARRPTLTGGLLGRLGWRRAKPAQPDKS